MRLGCFEGLGEGQRGQRLWLECVCYMLQQLVLHLLHSEEVTVEVTLLQQLQHYHHLVGQEVNQMQVMSVTRE